MTSANSNFKIKFGIILTLLSLGGIAFIFDYSQAHQWTSTLSILEIVLILCMLIGFYLSFIRTGLWSFRHRSLKKLDEREIMIISSSLRKAYAIFSVIVLCYLLFAALTEQPVSMVTAISFILFAHLLPASILGWTRGV